MSNSEEFDENEKSLLSDIESHFHVTLNSTSDKNGKERGNGYLQALCDVTSELEQI